jgi:hypothetical protein
MNRFFFSYTIDGMSDFVKNSSNCCLIIFLFLTAQIAHAQTQPSEISDSQIDGSHMSNTLKITLSELGETITLYPDSRCRLNQETQLDVEAIAPLWQNIVSKPYLERLSGLAILEQVKQRAQQSRMVITIDSDVETKLTIQTNENTQNISLYSIDLMYSTYPKAKLLGQFMEIVILMRKAKEFCVVK